MHRISSDKDYYADGKVVIDADGIPFEPASKDYVDQRVPIGSFTGTGSPEGNVAAPIGSVYTDTAATNGAIRWIKTSGTGNTGWRVEYGDTGWRDISDNIDTSTLDIESGGHVRIRRTERFVEYSFKSVKAKQSGNVYLPRPAFVPPMAKMQTPTSRDFSPYPRLGWAFSAFRLTQQWGQIESLFCASMPRLIGLLRYRGHRFKEHDYGL